SWGEPFVASADGMLLAVASGHSVRLYDTKGHPILPDLDRFPPKPADRFSFSADGRRMLTSGGMIVQTWELPSSRLLASFPVSPGGAFGGSGRAALSPDGRWAIHSSRFDMRLVVRDAETGQVVGDPARQENKLLAGLD